MEKMRTGIDFLDSRVEGLYAGTFNVLLEEVGAGGTEFVMTTMLNNLLNDTAKVFYASLTKTHDRFVTEFKLSFPKRDVGGALEKINFRSFVKTYFSRSIVPLSWVEERVSLLALKEEKSILEELIEFFEEVEDRSICVIDSLSDLVRLTRSRISWNDMIDFLMGLKTIIKKKNVVVYTILTKGILDYGMQEEILSQADGVFVFEWREKGDRMVRTMFIKRLLGILPLLERERITLCEVIIDPERGFVVSSVMRVI